MRTDLQKPSLIVRLVSRLQRLSPRARRLRKRIYNEALVEGDDPFKDVVLMDGQVPDVAELARQAEGFAHDRFMDEAETETQPDRPDVLKGAVEQAGGECFIGIDPAGGDDYTGLVYADYAPKQINRPGKPEDYDDGE